MSDDTPTWFEIREQVEHNTYFTADEFDRMIDQERAEERERAQGRIQAERNECLETLDHRQVYDRGVLYGLSVAARLAGENRASSEPVHIQVASRKGGKNSTLADMIVERANARGIRVEFVEPDREPSDAEVRVMAQHLAQAALDWDDIETYADDHSHSPSCTNWQAYEDDARAALLAAQEVRRG